MQRHNSESHFQDALGHAKRWVKEWGHLPADSITSEMIQPNLDWRTGVSNLVANKEIKLLRALFNFGIKKKLIRRNPASEL